MRDIKRDESIIGVKNEWEGVVMRVYGAGSGIEWMRWRWRMIRKWRGALRAAGRMGSASMVIVAASAVAGSLHFLFDFDFLVFFGHAALSVAPGVHLSCGAMKLSARRRASLRANGGGSRANRGETLGDPV